MGAGVAVLAERQHTHTHTRTGTTAFVAAVKTRGTTNDIIQPSSLPENKHRDNGSIRDVAVGHEICCCDVHVMLCRSGTTFYEFADGCFMAIAHCVAGEGCLSHRLQFNGFATRLASRQLDIVGIFDEPVFVDILGEPRVLKFTSSGHVFGRGKFGCAGPTCAARRTVGVVLLPAPHVTSYAPTTYVNAQPIGARLGSR